MSVPHRRLFLASSLAMLAVPHFARAETENVPCNKLFPFLEPYLGIPEAQRTRFHLDYVLKLNGISRDKVSFTLTHAGKSTAIRINADNSLSPLPPLAALKAKAPVSIVSPDGTRISMALYVVAKVPLAAEMDASGLRQAVAQAHDGARKAAGLMSVAVPNIDRAAFVGATSGQAIYADGRSVALPLTPAKAERVESRAPYFVPSDHASAVKIRLDRSPLRVHITPKMK